MPDRPRLTEELKRRLGLRVVEHGAIESTMAAAAADDGPAPAVHVAVSQTAGRGRHGRSWRSPAGNLHATIRWPETGEPFPPGVLGAIQLAWVRAVRAAGGPEVRCKWPNDGLLKGRKWAGILAIRPRACPGELHLGLGANLVEAPAVESAATACLADAWSGWPGGSEVAAILLEAALAVLADGPAGVPARLADWSRYDALAPGQRIVVEDRGDRREGTYLGIDGDGRLRLDLGTREVRLTSGDARCVRPA